VIVPVYNTQRWLPEALASIDRQPRRSDLEVIVVDDGSPDDSATIAREYAGRAPNVRYVRQDNAGLGAARNHGLRLATGRYLAFLDSDDIYPPDGLSTLLALADEHAAPVVVGDMRGLPPRPSPPWRREIVIGQRVIDSLAQAPDLVGNPSACNKVFRRDFVTTAGATFTEGTAFEDVLFTLPLLLRADRMVLTPHLAYLYRQRGDGSSIMDNRSQPVKIMQHLGIIERLAGELDNVDPGTRRAVHRWISYMQLHYAWRAASALDDEQLAEFTRRMAALFKDIPIEVAGEFVSNPGAGIRAAGIYEQDVVAVRTPRLAGPLLVRHGQVYAGHPHFDRYRELLKVTTMSAAFTGVISGPTPVITGRLRLPGIAATPGEIRHDLLVEVGDALVRRPVLAGRVSGDILHWSCEIPLDAVGPGSHPLRLVVRDDVAEVVVPAATGTVNSRAVAIGQGLAAWIRSGTPTPRLVIAGSVPAVVLHGPRRLAGMVYTRGAAFTRRGGKKMRRVLGPAVRRAQRRLSR
jgi:glycosyltransferase involved in cell wall biosynthesis